MVRDVRAPTTSKLEEAVARNADAYAKLMTLIRLVDADFKAGRVPSPNFDAYEQASVAVTQSSYGVVANAEAGQQVFTADGPLVVASVDKVVTAGLEHDRFVMTDDGGVKGQGWHEGAEADAVRYEVWMGFKTEAGRLAVSYRAHGFLDAKSRKVTQTG